MTLNNLKKLYKHFSFLSSDTFTAESFNKEFGDGFMHMGKLPADRRALIVSDAKKNLKDLIDKYPELNERKKEVVKAKEVEEKKLNNSKGK